MANDTNRLQRAIFGLGAKLIELSGCRSLILGTETVGLILTETGADVIEPVTPMQDWEAETTFTNVLIIGAIGEILNSAKNNPTLADGIYASAAAAGVSLTNADELVRELIGAWAVGNPQPQDDAATAQAVAEEKARVEALLA